MEDSVLLRREGAVATLVLNRPERRNALDLEMWRRLGDALTGLCEDESLRCVVLKGAGGAFAAGADIAEFERVRYTAKQAIAYAEVMECATTALANCRHPTLAVIEGACIGGGLEIAIHCDIRLCDAGAKFGIPINRLGNCLPYSAMTALVEVAGRTTALEMLLEGRLLTAEEAYQRRLVTRVYPKDALAEAAAESISRIAAGAPLAARWHKTFARKALNPAALGDEDRRAPYLCCDTEDYREGIRAFLAKETPKFKGR